MFGHFIIALNTAFDQQLLLADEGYESGSDAVDLPTPLRKTPRIHHVSSMEHASFNPAPVTPRNIPQTPPRPVCRHLSFSSADNNTSRQYLWTMNIGFLKKYQKEHCAFMNMDDHMGYAHTHALMQTIRCPLTWTAWI